MLYKHKDVGKKIKSIFNPVFANLSIRDRLYGTICLSKREVYNLGKPKDAYYLRYFTFRKQFRGSNPKNNSKAESKIRNEVSELMNGKGLPHGDDLLLYAYVDKENFRSKRLIDEFGFDKVGEFNVIPFSRIYAKIDSRVEKLEDSTKAETKQVLMDYYCDVQLVSFDQLFSVGDYYVIRDTEGEIMCGVQAIIDGWEILELPGISGKLMMKVVPKLPLVGRLFNSDYKFAFFEYVYCKPGFEKDFEMLLESILGTLKMNSGVLCLDPNSKLCDQLNNIRFGLTHKLMGESRVDIVVKSRDKTFISDNAPFYVSGFDVL